MRGCTCRGSVLCPWCTWLAQRAGVGAPPEAPAVTEKQFMQAVMRYATAHAWLVYHTHDSRRSLPGYPDLTLVHPERQVALWAELKVGDAQPTLQQGHWLKALAAVRETTAVLWTPEEWPDIRMRLT